MPKSSATLFDDSVHGRQPQAGAFALALGRKERVVQMEQNLRSHTDPGVGNSQLNIVAWLYSGMPFGLAEIQFHIVGLDEQFAAGRHGVARIHSEVHQHLMQLPGSAARVH